MTNGNQSLFERLNAPFPYQEYKYDKFRDRCYVSGQTIAERLNEVLGVGFWKYKGLSNTEKVVQEPNGKSQRVKIYVEFRFYNPDLKEWITLIDVGSEQIKAGMNEGDATKSAITDGMKKCASRIGVASDLYKGLISWDPQQQMIILPSHYKNNYEEKFTLPKTQTITSESKNGRRKKALTEKLKSKNNSAQEQIQSLWLVLAGSNDGFIEWYQKKLADGASDQQILQILLNKLQKKNEASA